MKRSRPGTMNLSFVYPMFNAGRSTNSGPGVVPQLLRKLARCQPFRWNQPRSLRRQVIFNADDFGFSRSINAAVIDSFEKGVVCSASVMASGPEFEEAADYARKNTALDLGVHLTLCDGAPICDPAKVPSLVQHDGRFSKDHRAFIKRYFSGKISLPEVALELAAQIARIRAAGVSVTHLDSHQHLHALPAIFGVLLRLAEDHGISAVRMPAERMGLTLPIQRMLPRLGLSLSCRSARRHLTQSPVRIPDHFFGFANAGRWNAANLRQTIVRLRPGVTEICCHPGSHAADLSARGWSGNPRAELDALISPEFRSFLKEQGVSVTSFRERFPATHDDQRGH